MLFQLSEKGVYSDSKSYSNGNITSSSMLVMARYYLVTFDHKEGFYKRYQEHKNTVHVI